MGDVSERNLSDILVNIWEQTDFDYLFSQGNGSELFWENGNLAGHELATLAFCGACRKGIGVKMSSISRSR